MGRKKSPQSKKKRSYERDRVVLDKLRRRKVKEKRESKRKFRRNSKALLRDGKHEDLDDLEMEELQFGSVTVSLLDYVKSKKGSQR